MADIYIIMGISGSGKTTVGKLLAQRLNIPFTDADDHHGLENLEKMQAGNPLTDEDRQPWLEKLHEIIMENKEKDGLVLACSALKEKYRQALQKGIPDLIQWVFLHGEEELLKERLQNRKGHFFSEGLFQSQLDILEEPAYGIHVDIKQSPEEIVQEIMEKKDKSGKAAFGIIGMGVMGRNLAKNLASKNISVAAYNRHVAGMEEDIAQGLAAEEPQMPITPYDDLSAFISGLERPRKILLMIKAGDAVDATIEQLAPLLNKDDILMDGGNSHYEDTLRRRKYLSDRDIHFLGVGISGGEEGARHGASIMPGGHRAAYDQVARELKNMSAKDKHGGPCCTYIGPDGAGHFVKMVHNGIEYAEMQTLAEIYFYLKEIKNISTAQIGDIFDEWINTGLRSFLLEITRDILQKEEDGEPLLDKILDAAEQKGTGNWSAVVALQLGVPLSPIAEAVTARYISALKKERVLAEKIYKREIKKDDTIHVDSIRNAYHLAHIFDHAVGFNLMRSASQEWEWDLDLSAIARIWTNGCIIRSELMEQLVEVLKHEENILVEEKISAQLRHLLPDCQKIVASGIGSGIAMPVMSASLNYLLGYTTASSPANLIQAQRDYFGAHTFRRVDKGQGEYFHVEWGKPE